MGSKSSSAPAPDPRLIDAQIRSMGIQDSSIQRLLSNSESMMPLQREQMQFGLDTSRSAYQQSQEDRSWMLGRRGMLSAVQDRIASDATNFDEDSRAAELSAAGMADIQAGAGAARSSAMRTAGLRGMNTAKISEAFARQGTQMASAQANAAFMAKTAAKAEGLQLTDRANNALAGYPAMSMQATGAGAGYGAAGLGLANAGLGGMNSGFQAAGGMAGQMGNNAAGMYGAMGSYKNGQDQIAAQNDPFNTILGAAAGAGMSALMKGSDRRLKTDIKPVGVMNNGLTVYSYRYKSGGPTELGVMADEVAVRKPQAYVKGGAGGGYDAVDYSKL